MEDAYIKVSMTFGHVEVDSEFRPDGTGVLRGFSRRRTYDRDGILTGTTEWEPTGVWMIPAEERPRTWRERMLSWVGL